jgi:uncharacterized protein YutE (UPF0331/DUF86 family)
MNRAYTASVREHCRVHFQALLELANTLDSRALGFHERNSAERSIQVITEACIGLARHCCRKAGREVLGDAAGCAMSSLEIIGTDAIAPEQLRGALGMRNAIVHDYLNLDWGLVEQVLRERAFLALDGYVEAAIGFLDH